MNLFDSFISWVNENRVGFIRQGLEAALTINDSGKNYSARLDVDSETTTARITLWDTGSAYLEVINLISDETIYSKHLNLNELCNFDNEFRDFFYKLKIN